MKKQSPIKITSYMSAQKTLFHKNVSLQQYFLFFCCCFFSIPQTLTQIHTYTLTQHTLISKGKVEFIMIRDCIVWGEKRKKTSGNNITESDLLPADGVIA